MKTILSTSGITKVFGGIHALKGVDFELQTGEVHALLGENGAGKSTLIKVLSGAHAPNSGHITVDGVQYSQYSPDQAMELGISTIYQETSLFPDLSVAENLFAGKLIQNKWALDWKEMIRKSDEIFSTLGVHIPATERLGNLGKASAQLVEIAKALTYNAKILIMDEPTAALSAGDTQRLFDIIRKLKADGTAIIFISHHLEEVMEIADRATIFRDGEMVGTALIEDVDAKWIVNKMVGKEFSQSKLRSYREPGKDLLNVNNLSRGKFYRDVNLTLREGEVLGIAGLVGAGKTELLRSIFGIDPIDSGEIQYRNERLPKSTFGIIKKGIGLIPEDRGKEGLLLQLSSSLNLSMTTFRKDAKLGIIDKSKELGIAKEMFDALNIHPSGMYNMIAKNFSGGNQQKIVLGKWLAGNPAVLMLDDPTQGVDVHAKFEIHKLIDNVVNKGMGVILVSSDFQELVDLSDRVMVMRSGRFVAELDKGCEVSDIIDHVSGQGKE